MHFWIIFLGYISILFLLPLTNSFDVSYADDNNEKNEEPKWIKKENNQNQFHLPVEHRTRFPGDDGPDLFVVEQRTFDKKIKPFNFIESGNSDSLLEKTITPGNEKHSQILFPLPEPLVFEETTETSPKIISPNGPKETAENLEKLADSDAPLTGEILPDQEDTTTDKIREEKVLNLNRYTFPQIQYVGQPFPQIPQATDRNPYFSFQPSSSAIRISEPPKLQPAVLTGENSLNLNRKEANFNIVKSPRLENNNKESGRHFKPQTLKRISETLGALNTVGRFLVNVTSGIETPNDEVPTAIYTISKNVLGPNVTDTIAPFVLSNVNGIKIANSPVSSTVQPHKDSRICTTPDNLLGYCDDLSMCPQLLLNLRVLRESICFKNLFVPGVCCPRTIDKIEHIQETTSSTTSTTSKPIKLQAVTNNKRETIVSTTSRPPLISVPILSKPLGVIKNNSTLNITPVAENIVDPKDCGQSQSAKYRVIGGEEALPGRWPWMAAIFLHGNQRTEFWCGGSLITAKHILTAAHCTRDSQQRPFPPRQFTVRLGDIDLKRNDEPSSPVTFKVKEVKIHPKFSRIGFYNDIAIFTLDRPARRSRYVVPLCLPSPELREETFAGQRTTVVGWGTTYYGGKESTVQRQAVLPIWRNEDCDQAYFQPITSNFICAGYSRGGVDACQGDSGGPLMLQRNTRWIQIGVVSFGNKCGEPGYPGVYTRVTEYLDWIKENTKD